MDIVRRCWDEKNARVLRTQILDGSYFVAEQSGKVVGLCGVRPSHLMRNAWELPWLAVDPDYHGSGLGSNLVERATSEAGRLLASLILTVTQKPGFFQRFGFKAVEHYNDNWTLMTVQLTALGLGSLVT